MKIKLGLFLCLSLLSNAAFAETLKETADRICHAYIDHPEEFKKAETSPCKIASSSGIQEEKCFSYFDASTKLERKFNITYAGSCLSPMISEIGPDNEQKYLETENATVNGYGFGSSEEPLIYKDQFLFSQNGDDLRIMFDKKMMVLCRFTNELQGWEKPIPKNNDICKKFGDNQFSINANLIAESGQDWPNYKNPRRGRIYEGHAEGLYKTDLDGDDIKEQIINYSYSSGAGCGCGASMFYLLQNGKPVGFEDDAEENTPQTGLAKALRDFTGACDRSDKSFLIELDEKNYFVKGASSPTVSEDKKYTRTIPVRELYEYQSGKFVKICSQKAKTKKVIQHEVYPASSGRLDYKPLD